MPIKFLEMPQEKKISPTIKQSAHAIIRFCVCGKRIPKARLWNNRARFCCPLHMSMYHRFRFGLHKGRLVEYWKLKNVKHAMTIWDKAREDFEKESLNSYK